MGPRARAQLAFVTTTSDSYRQIKLWTQYHQSLGVGRFYLFVDGQARAAGASNARRDSGRGPPRGGGPPAGAQGLTRAARRRRRGRRWRRGCARCRA